MGGTEGVFHFTPPRRTVFAMQQAGAGDVTATGHSFSQHTIQVPRNCGPGSVLEVTAASGKHYVTVPPGVAPGDYLAVRVQLASEATAAEAADVPLMETSSSFVPLPD